MPPTLLLPSYPAPSWEQLEHLLQELAGIARAFQIDLVDGQFAPHRSWPFTESDPIGSLQKLVSWSRFYRLEFDCMVKEPLQYLDQIVGCGAKSVVVHLGSTTNYQALFVHQAEHNYQLGFALTNDVPLEELLPWLPDISFVQLMGIREVGQQSQPFDGRTLERARFLRQHYPELDIAVDGGVNAETIPLLLAAGVNRFAPGSAITKANNPVLAYKQLLGLITA